MNHISFSFFIAVSCIYINRNSLTIEKWTEAKKIVSIDFIEENSEFSIFCNFLSFQWKKQTRIYFKNFNLISFPLLKIYVHPWECLTCVPHDRFLNKAQKVSSFFFENKYRKHFLYFIVELLQLPYRQIR